MQDFIKELYIVIRTFSTKWSLSFTDLQSICSFFLFFKSIKYFAKNIVPIKVNYRRIKQKILWSFFFYFFYHYNYFWHLWGKGWECTYVLTLKNFLTIKYVWYFLFSILSLHRCFPDFYDNLFVNGFKRNDDIKKLLTNFLCCKFSV